MIFKNSILFLLLFCSLFTIFGQETVKNIDSLLLALSNSKVDSTKAHLYQKIAGHYNVTHLDSAKSFAEKGIILSKKINYNLGLWINYNTLGNYYERKTKYQEAMNNYNLALDIIEKNNDTKGFAVVLNNIATIHIRKADYDKALDFIFEALKAEEKLDNQNGIAQAYNNIGVVYYYLQNFEKTTYYLTKALEIQEGLGNFDGLINGYNNVGAIFDYQKKYDEAINSYQKGLAISQKIKDKKLEAIQLSNIALAYANKEEYKIAENFFNKSIQIKTEIRDFSGLASTYTSFGEALVQQKLYIKAEEYLQKGLEIANKNGLKLSKKLIYRSLSELAQKQNNYKKANNYLKKLLIIKDSILNENNIKAIAEVETKYETEKKEKEILKQRVEIAEKEIEVKQKNYIILGSLALTLILGLFGYLFFNQQKIKNQQLKKESQLKVALAKIETQNKLQEQRLRISRDLHDNIGAQLTFIISSLDNLKFGFKDIGEKLSIKLTGISAFTTQTIYELRDTIWAMNKNQITFEDLQVRISNFINQAKDVASSTNFDFTISQQVNRKQSFTSLEGMNMYRIIQEAINNAIKYAKATKIEVVVSEKEGLQIQIKDNGVGFNIDEAKLGNGLNNIKKRSRDLQGVVTINSSKGKGTTISLKIPKGTT